MKKKVNLVFLSYLMGPLTGGADDDKMVFKYMHVDPNDEASIKQIIGSEMLPTFNGRSEIFKNKIKLALSYVLSTDKNMGGEFDSNLMPFDHPDNPNLFYKWIWEIFFQNEKFEWINTSEYEEIEDLEEPLVIAHKERNM